MAPQDGKVLDQKLLALSEDFDEKLGDAFNGIVESFEGRVESLIERFGAATVAERMKRYSIFSPGGTLYSVFRPLLSVEIVEETWAVDEET